MGRLAARRAYKRLRLLLYWLQQELGFSEGCEERINWMSEAVRGLGGRDGGVRWHTTAVMYGSGGEGARGAADAFAGLGCMCSRDSVFG